MDRSFFPTPTFNEVRLPRQFHFHPGVKTQTALAFHRMSGVYNRLVPSEASHHWFSSADQTLQFGIIRGDASCAMSVQKPGRACGKDLTALIALRTKRTLEFKHLGDQLHYPTQEKEEVEEPRACILL